MRGSLFFILSDHIKIIVENNKQLIHITHCYCSTVYDVDKRLGEICNEYTIKH